MTRRIRGDPHDGLKQRGKSLSTPLEPDGYALSPSVKTSVRTLAALSDTRMLSTIRPVASSPLVPQTAMSPAPTIVTAPGNSSSFSPAPEGGGVGFLSPEHAMATAHNRSSQLECKADAGVHPVGATVGEQNVDALAGVEESDPEAATRRGMPSTRRIAVQINLAGIGEANRADVQRQNERELGDRHPQLGGAIERCVAGVALLLLRSERLRSTQESGVEVGERAPQLFSTCPQRQHRLLRNVEGEEARRPRIQRLIGFGHIPHPRITIAGNIENEPGLEGVGMRAVIEM